MKSWRKLSDTQSDRLYKATERQLLSTDRFIKTHNTAFGTLNTSAVQNKYTEGYFKKEKEKGHGQVCDLNATLEQTENDVG